MKKAIKSIADMVHQAEPSTAFTIVLWDGEELKYGNSPQVTLHFKTKGALRRMMKDGFLGFGEAHMMGEIDISGDMAEILRLGFTIHFEYLRPSAMMMLRIFLFRLMTRDTVRQAPKNIAEHYDLGNDFYALYLDRTMTYSCGYFRKNNDPLEQAQLNKYEHIARKLMLKEGETLLDIGCGWGGMLIYAASKYGVKGRGVTLSRHQHEYANEEIDRLGLKDLVSVEYKDYRELDGKFDKIVSIGMFEHVGKRYIPNFMKKIADLLAVGGVGLLHTIGKDRPTATDPWTLKYVFPGGYLPCLTEITREMGRCGFSVLDVENLRLHYAKTLEKWIENYERNAGKVMAMFDQVFVRRWRLFLHSSAAGFKYGNTRLFQVLFSNGLNNHLPLTREHVYQNMGN
ncbi:MAG: class I SAM-dependent methyltransferase [Deltaproteobacteria bacterium]|nr:class I SAM-dependent methyltransferase [Deltaproteobacteria bacterium]MBW2142407.1 class I SAM-dependent methyltransferase [Deltaproteobacteria bacterium]MBW2324099.1 class I SAM-dependent methyltransferase [Deltaproteobacteria bacterium]